MSDSQFETQKSETKIPRLKLNRRYSIGLSVIAVIGAGFLVSPLVHADRFTDQINSLNQQNSTKKENLGQLDNEAANLQDTIARLQAEIAGLQSQIVTNEAKRVETVAKIAEAEAELVRQKAVLGDNVKAMYLDGGMSKLEELATSKSLDEFANQEQYRVSVQNKIQATLTAINDLKTKLATEKVTLERMIADLQDMRGKVASQQAEQARLLALNQAQQSELDAQIRANNSKVGDLRKQQAAENARLFQGRNGRGAIPAGIPGGGGYPGKWAFAPIDSIVDSWGMYNRECVSWTAFKVANSGRYMPYWGGKGNANQWDDNARASGIPIDGNPQVGDVAVSNAGRWGHVMYVEQVASDGAVYVSDYNQQFDGVYREYWISAETVAARGLQFIHFQ